AEVIAREEQADPTAVDANLAGVVVRLAAIRADKRRVDEIVTEYLARRERRAAPEEQVRWLRALPAVEKAAPLRTVLALTTTETIPQEQLVMVLRGLLARPTQALATWRFLQQEWETIAGRTGPTAISRLVEGLGSLPARQRRAIERFFAAHPVPEAER